MTHPAEKAAPSHLHAVLSHAPLLSSPLKGKGRRIMGEAGNEGFLRHCKRGIKGKQGQFYILTAIVLITYAFTIVRPSAVAQERTDAFKELYQNFISESPVVVNNALYDGANVSERFSAFAGSYADYAVTKSPNFRFLYVLRDGDSMLVGNRLGVSVSVTVGGSSYNVTDRSVIAVSPADVGVDVAGVSYSIGIGPEAYQVRSLFRQKSDDGLRVYVNG